MKQHQEMLFVQNVIQSMSSAAAVATQCWLNHISLYTLAQIHALLASFSTQPACFLPFPFTAPFTLQVKTVLP